jgi:PAS domain S-box-containing protein
MDLIRKGSIKQKLMRISMLTTCVALLLTSVLLIANEVIAFRQSLIERMGVMAKIIGTNSTAALTFNDQKTAEETLYALKSGKNITCAILYNRKGDVLAQYIRNVSAGDCRPHPVSPDEYHLGIDHLDTLQRIHLDNESIGTLYIQSDLKELYQLIQWYVVTVCMVILLSIAIAFLLMSRLQKIITKPLSDMADVMNTISRGNNYSVRVAIQSQDEVGILGEGFNEMLSQIQKRDTELELHREHLQDLVTQRTEELARTNIDLQQELADRKKAEETVRKSEAHYRLLAEHMTDIVWMMDLDLNVTWLSPSAMKARGFSVDEIAALPLDRQLTPESLGKAANWLGKLMRLEKDGLISEPDGILSRELEFYCKDGRTIMLDCTFQFLRDEQGKATGILAEGKDITARKRAEEELLQTLDSLRKAVGTTIQVMVSAVESRDPYTAGHQIRSANLARAIATEMGLPPEKIEGICMAGSIHDIGKLSIPAEILSKPTKLSELEFSLIKEHSQKGYKMLKNVESPWPLAEIVFQHHERMDGSGYPRNLKGEEILIEARILAVADVVEAMASHRPYRPGLGIDAALNEIEKNRGIFYDKAVSDACLRLFQEKGFQLEGI